MKNTIKLTIGAIAAVSVLSFGTGNALAGIAMPEVLPGTYNVPVSAADLALRDTFFGAGNNANGIYMNGYYDPTVITTTGTTAIDVTFVSEGAGYESTLGYYTYSPGAFAGLTHGAIDIDGQNGVSLQELIFSGAVSDIGFVFPNASSGYGQPLSTGDTYSLGGGTIFPAGTQIGLFLIQDGWDDLSNQVNGVFNSDGDYQTFYSTDFLNPENAPSNTIATDSSNVDSRHVGMLFTDSSQTKILVGFEDLNRIDRFENPLFVPTDEDFNDVVFIVSGDVSSTQIPVAPIPLAGSAIGTLFLMGAGMGLRRRK